MRREAGLRLQGDTVLAAWRTNYARSVLVTLPLASAASLLASARAVRHVPTLQYDAQGALLACAGPSGGVQVLDTLDLRASLRAARDGAPAAAAADVFLRRLYPGLTAVAPLLHLAKHRRAEALRWSPAQPDVLAVSCAKDSEVHLFDLGICDVDAPTRVLASQAGPAAPGSHSAPCTTATPPLLKLRAGGLFDVVFSQDGRRLLAAGQAGKVMLWDLRAACTPRATMIAPRAAGALLSLQLAHGDLVVNAGSEGGELLCWDLRGGRHAAAFMAATQAAHPLLHALQMASLLQGVPGLADEVDIEISALSALAMDPMDERRMAFQLACGWTGVVDLTALELTHVHCPPPPWFSVVEPTPVQHAEWAVRLRPGWTQDGLFLAGSHAEPILRVLDFAGIASAACHVGRGNNCRDCPGCRSCLRPLELRCMNTAVAVAVHPRNGDIVVGTQAGNLEMRGPGPPDAPPADQASR